MKNTFPYDNSSVRRQDRLLSEEAAMNLLENGEYCIMSMIDLMGESPMPYAVPLSYAYDGDKSIYIHCAPQGRKLDIIKKEPSVVLTIVGTTNVIPEKFTTAYECILITGKASIGLSTEERHQALELIIQKYSQEYRDIGLKYIDKSFHRTEIIKITIEEISGKAKIIK